MKQAIEEFICLADDVVAELNDAIARDDKTYLNAEIALVNVTEWLLKAKSGTLPGAYQPNFGLSKSDLMFGAVESRMYELEDLYVKKIRDKE